MRLPCLPKWLFCRKRFVFVKPRLKVKTGDNIKVGTPVFEDKRNSNLTFFIAGRG
ncbi:MAG: hypothetical protein JRD01_12775 [Deltaproteobacteria bacterium]|nr:hypothetical protein [Deltaproteobacteria bacterium]